MTPSANLSIAWSEIDKREYTDALGRAFNWTGLKNKTIYLCGHGAHIYYDGYTTVPAGTTVNFYQVYGQAMYHHHLMKFLAGAQWRPERSYEAGKSCPNMTLFDDDEPLIGPTNEAINARLKTSPDKNDHYAFFCNGFRGLLRYAPVQKPGIPSHPFVGKHVLKLSDILPRLKGNTLEWACCQDLAMERNQYMKDGKAYTWGALRENESSAAYTAADKATDTREKLFSKTVQIGLIAARRIKGGITAGYNLQGSGRIVDSHLEGSVVGTLHGNPIRQPLAYLNRRRAGTSPEALESARNWRQQILAAIQSLDTEPQPQPPFEHVWASETLKRGLLTAESLLNAFGAGNVSKTTT